jgi:hypothetical protein
MELEFGQFCSGEILRILGGRLHFLRRNFVRLGVAGAVAGTKFLAAELAGAHFAVTGLHFFENYLDGVHLLSAFFPFEPNGEVLAVFAMFGEFFQAAAEATFRSPDLTPARYTGR